jgi:sn-glycerol 3-phosphate transport system ATP-binding protein
MDEPLSNLDARLRAQMRRELVRIHRKLDATFVYITHDQAEAMSLGDYIAVMDKGRIMQYGTSEDVYDNPANVFTAKFIGDPGMNVLPQKDGTYIGFRGHKVCVGQPGEPGCLVIKGSVSTREHLGDAYCYKITASEEVQFEMRRPERIEEGESLDMFVRKDDLYAFDEKGFRVSLGARPPALATGGTEIK